MGLDGRAKLNVPALDQDTYPLMSNSRTSRIRKECSKIAHIPPDFTNPKILIHFQESCERSRKAQSISSAIFCPKNTGWFERKAFIQQLSALLLAPQFFHLDFIYARSKPHHLMARIGRFRESMGRNRNRRDRQIQIDEAELSSPAPRFHRWNPSVRAPPSPQFGPPSPSIDDGNSTFNRDNPFQRHPQPPQQDQPHQQWYQNDRKQPYPYTQTPQGIPLYIFVQKSQRLKQNLVRAFDQALAQIEQWYPDATAGGDLMEWQPENEIVIPQSDHTVYTYGLPVMQMGEHGNAENQVQESMLGAAPSASGGL